MDATLLEGSAVARSVSSFGGIEAGVGGCRRDCLGMVERFVGSRKNQKLAANPDDALQSAHIRVAALCLGQTAEIFQYSCQIRWHVPPRCCLSLSEYAG